MPQEPQTEIIVRDWQPGQAYNLAFVRPGEWKLSKPHLPPNTPIFKVIPGGAAAMDPQPDPDSEPEPEPPSPPPDPPPASASELLIFDWNQPVTTAERGFPWDKPPADAANGDWTKPINYAEGTMHFRAEIREMPSEKIVRLQFCQWQDGNKLQACGDLGKLYYLGIPIVLEWSQPIREMGKLNGVPLDWTRARNRCGIAVKNAAGLPVSDYSGWNWNGEVPAQWYPMNIRFTAVVVEKGKIFGGWSKYIQ
jgi:hypothetical protein